MLSHAWPRLTAVLDQSISSGNSRFLCKRNRCRILISCPVNPVCRHSWVCDACSMPSSGVGHLKPIRALFSALSSPQPWRNMNIAAFATTTHKPSMQLNRRVLHSCARPPALRTARLRVCLHYRHVVAQQCTVRPVLTDDRSGAAAERSQACNIASPVGTHRANLDAQCTLMTAMGSESLHAFVTRFY